VVGLEQLDNRAGTSPSEGVPAARGPLGVRLVYGSSTGRGLHYNLTSAFAHTPVWLSGNSAVAIQNLMEDGARG